MVHKNQHILLVAKKTTAEIPGHRSVFFNRPKNFEFEAGDWIDIEHVSGTITGGKTYSLSSSPTEPALRITFKEGFSERKRALQSVVGSEKFYISQYGNDYGFQLQHNRTSILIAGGVGIAPFRSMIKEMYDTQNPNTITLIYLANTDEFLFQSELDEWQRSLRQFRVNYINTKQLNRKKREKLILSLINDMSAHFYISGPEAMVESTEHLLLDAGVAIKNIRIDSFGGY